MRSIYLDNNATTFLHPEVAEVMAGHMRQSLGNPASQHAVGRHARGLVEDAREGIAELLGADAIDQVVFTSGGTESNNLAIEGLAGPQPANLVVSTIEHPSVIQAARRLTQHGFRVQELPVDHDGRAIVASLDELIDGNTRLLCLMLGNNETGVIQPVAEIAHICASRGISMHTDAVQAVGKVPVDFSQLGVTTLSLTAHKFHGPRGVGALIVREGTQLEPMLTGGFQQAGLRPGTEPVELVVGLFTALNLYRQEADERSRRITSLREHFERSLLAEAPELEVQGASAPRLPHTSNVAFPGVDRQALMMALDLAGVACSTGSACASGSSEPSPVLRAMGLDEAIVESALRFSFSALTTAAEIDRATSCILSVYRDLQHRIGKRKPPPSSRNSLQNAI